MRLIVFCSFFLIACNPPVENYRHKSQGYSYERDFSEPTLEPQSDQYEGYCRELKEAIMDDLLGRCADKEKKFNSGNFFDPYFYYCWSFSFQYQIPLKYSNKEKEADLYEQINNNFGLKYMSENRCKKTLTAGRDNLPDDYQDTQSYNIKSTTEERIKCTYSIYCK